MSDARAALTRHTLNAALEQLAARDVVLELLLRQFGRPPLWSRTQSYATLVQIVLEQKVSLSSARAVMQRVQALCPGVTPGGFLRLSDSALRSAGVSARKVSYCRSIAGALIAGDIDLAHLPNLSNQQVIESLCQIRGIGPWTAGVYLMMAMRRPDAWANGDRALAVSLAESESTGTVPADAELEHRAEDWRPYRAAAARLLWHAYLKRRGRAQPPM